MESARANDLDVYECLKYLLTEMPNNHYLEDPSVIEQLLPWSKELPEQCHMKRNGKKCIKYNDVGKLTEILLVCTTPCYEAFTIKTCRGKRHAAVEGMKLMSNLICGEIAVGGNYNSPHDTMVVLHLSELLLFYYLLFFQSKQVA